MIEEDFKVPTRSGECLACSLFAPDGLASLWPVAVLFHGFASQRLNEINSALAPRLVARGIACVVADLSGHGQSTGTIATQNILSAADEISDVVAHVANDKRIDSSRVVVLGNSFSGAAGIVAALNLDIVALVLKAPACDYEHIRYEQLGEAGMKKWEQNGTIQVSPGVEVDWSSIEVAKTVDVFDSFAKLNVPVRVWQGTADEVIPATDWQRLEALCDDTNKTFVRVDGADHRVSGTHLSPFLEEVEEFFGGVLRS